MVEKKPKMRIFDLGCGSGELAKMVDSHHSVFKDQSEILKELIENFLEEKPILGCTSSVEKST